MAVGGGGEGEEEDKREIVGDGYMCLDRVAIQDLRQVSGYNSRLSSDHTMLLENQQVSRAHMIVILTTTTERSDTARLHADMVGNDSRSYFWVSSSVIEHLYMKRMSTLSRIYSTTAGYLVSRLKGCASVLNTHSSKFTNRSSLKIR